jgi:hypothetical protein
MGTPRDQPTDVSTEENPKAPDAAVTTSDTNFSKAVQAAAADEAGSNDQDSAPDATEKETRATKRHKRAERRWGRMTAKLSAAEKEAKDAAARVAELEKKVEELSAGKPSKAPEPQLSDFKTPQEYAKAYASWETKKTPKKSAPAKPAAPPAATKPDPEIKEFVERGKSMLGDEFQESLTVNFGVNQTMAEFMFDSDVGPALYVHLANNPEEAAKICNSSTIRATKILNDLEARAKKGKLDVDGELKFEKPEKDDPPPKRDPKTTRAKEPPSSTREAGANQPPPNPDTESMEDYAARRKQDELRKAGLIS